MSNKTASHEDLIAQWNHVISETNWVKGRIISEAANGVPNDGEWVSSVGGITETHVGNLRRVHNRFGGVRVFYLNLKWPHFLAALDWEDAEEWLKLADDQKLTVMQMREKRWVTEGVLPND